MKKFFNTFLFAAAIFALLTSCGGGKYSEEADSEDEATTEAAEDASAGESEGESAYSQETAYGITHSVTNYEEWYKVYAETSDPEGRLGIVVSMDDPQVVTVFEWSKSHEAAQEWLNSEELKEAMGRAGVSSEPEVTYYDMKYMNPGENTDPYRLAVNHEVEDFDTWKSHFDEDSERRAEAGLTLLGMATSPDNPNMVYIMFATSDVERAQEFMNNPELKAVMEEAGVISEPQATVWKVPDAE